MTNRMHKLLTNTDFSASHWQDFFDEILTVADASTLEKFIAQSPTIWLCTAIKEWPDLLKQLSAKGMDVAVLAMAPSLEEAKLALGLGARAYLQATASTELLNNVKTTLEAGGYWLPNDLLLHLVGQFNSLMSNAQSETADSRLAALTQREQEVCKEVAKGYSNKLIARRLGITERTVKEHLSHSFSKLGVKDRMHVMLLINGKLGAH